MKFRTIVNTEIQFKYMYCSETSCTSKHTDSVFFLNYPNDQMLIYGSRNLGQAEVDFFVNIFTLYFTLRS